MRAADRRPLSFSLEKTLPLGISFFCVSNQQTPMFIYLLLTVPHFEQLRGDLNHTYLGLELFQACQTNSTYAAPPLSPNLRPLQQPYRPFPYNSVFLQYF